MVAQPSEGSFSPHHRIETRLGQIQSPHHVDPGTSSAAASLHTNTLSGTNPLLKIVVAQVYLLLSTIKEDKASSRWEIQAEQLRKLLDENGMDVFSKYFTRLVAVNAPVIFPAPGRTMPHSGNYHLLVDEMRKLTRDVGQASRIADSIEGGTEEVFRDFDLNAFMDHFNLGALEKTTLALAFKTGSRQDLKLKADAILSDNFSGFVDVLSMPITESAALELDTAFISFIIDRFIQYHPPTFNAAAKAEFRDKVRQRYVEDSLFPPTEVLAALDLLRVLGDKPVNALALHIQRMGAKFTRDKQTCLDFLQARPKAIQLSEEQVSAALTYTTVSQSPRHNPGILTAALRLVLPASFSWQNVVSYFDQRYGRVSPNQFLRLYNALAPISREGATPTLDIQSLWGGHWENAETQLSYICAFGSLSPQDLDATTIPGLKCGIHSEIYARGAPPTVKERAALALRHPLSSVSALSAIFHVALHSTHASTTMEAKRLFQDVVVPNLDIFVVTAFEVPSPWGEIAMNTVASLLERFIHASSPYHDFVLYTLWMRHKERLVSILAELHRSVKLNTPALVDSAINAGIFSDMVYIRCELGCELALVAHFKNILDMGEWARRSGEHGHDVNGLLNSFISTRILYEMDSQRDKQTHVKALMPLTVRMVSVLLQVLEDSLPKSPMPQLIDLQRQCIAAYPRLVNYGEGYDDIIDANGSEGNMLQPAANLKMEEHYRKMYNNELQVHEVVELLARYKHSRDPLDQDIFACMIHGLLDEYGHYSGYPVEALATTAVLFGGILSRRLVPDLPLKVGLGMVLEAVKDHPPDHPMFKFGLQALLHLLGRFPEWPGFCTQLLQIPGLIGTEPWSKARKVVGLHEDDQDIVTTAGDTAEVVPATTKPDGGAVGRVGTELGVGRPIGVNDDAQPRLAEPAATGRSFVDGLTLSPFTAVVADPSSPTDHHEDPDADTQGRIQFVLNNLTDVTLPNLCLQLRVLLETTHQQWFASHLVDERAKMQPNYHHVYLELVRLMEDRDLWTEVLRATFVTVRRMLNSEAVMHNTTERAQLKNLGQWLGLLTLGRDRPIMHGNIAFRQLLIEGLDSQRLAVVIPFVCKVLVQAASSSIFRPPNPWLMDLVHLLVDLYHHADLKLNLKFEIEVLCQDLGLDLRSFEPSNELANRLTRDTGVTNGSVSGGPMEGFDGIPIGSLTTSLTMSSAPALHIPDVADMIHVPPINEMVITSSRLGEIIRKGFDYAIREIISAVVERSVTIAAIATTNMIRKDFATEGDENRVRDCAANMAKTTAGSLALVTSKDPMRAHLTNYIRTVSAELPQGLPEGTIMMCVNSNLDLGCSVIEKAAEERAVPEIEEIIRPDLEARRHHRITCPNDPFIDTTLTRWAMTMPNPFKLSPSMDGLNGEQMAIYEDFARQPRTPGTAPGMLAHATSGSDARSMSHEPLHEQFGGASNITAATEASSIPQPQQQPHQSQPSQLQPAQPQQQPQARSSQSPQQQQLGTLQPPAYGSTFLHHGALMGNRPTTSYQPHDQQLLGAFQRVQKLVQELQRVASDAREDHFHGLPRPHPVLDVIDALVQLTIKTSQTAEEFPSYAADQICHAIFSPIEDTLALESLVHVLETLRRIGVRGLESRVAAFFRQQPAEHFLHLPLIAALVRTDLVDWRGIDAALASAVTKGDPEALKFLGGLLNMNVLHDRPVLLFSDFTLTLEAAWGWIHGDPVSDAATRLQLKSQLPLPSSIKPDDIAGFSTRELMEYVFEEWVHRHQNPHASERGAEAFLRQLQAIGIMRDKEALFQFLRVGVDMAVDAFEQVSHAIPLSEALSSADALVHLVGLLLRLDSAHDAGVGSLEFVDSVMALMNLMVTHHHVTRGGHFNPKIFYRLMSGLLEEVVAFSECLSSDTEPHVLLSRVASRLADVGPRHLPGFAHAWLLLIQHRTLLTSMAGSRSADVWSILARLLCQQLEYLGELLKSYAMPTVVKAVYRATLKLLLVLRHDFPDFMVDCCMQLCASIPPYCTQLLGTVLASTPTSIRNHQPPRPTSLPGVTLGIDAPVSVRHAVSVIVGHGLRDLVDIVLDKGPSEDAVAHLARSFVSVEPETSLGHVPVNANPKLIGAFTIYAGYHALLGCDGNPPLDGPEAATLSLLVRELPTGARYFMLSWIINQLRFHDPTTDFFRAVLLDIFGHDLTDPDETDIRHQITRIILERLVGCWPQPWGLMSTIIDLVKNERFMFFELPFIKSTPDVAERFAAAVQQA